MEEANNEWMRKMEEVKRKPDTNVINIEEETNKTPKRKQGEMREDRKGESPATKKSISEGQEIMDVSGLQEVKVEDDIEERTTEERGEKGNESDPIKINDDDDDDEDEDEDEDEDADDAMGGGASGGASGGPAPMDDPAVVALGPLRIPYVVFTHLCGALPGDSAWKKKSSWSVPILRWSRFAASSMRTCHALSSFLSGKEIP